MTHDLDTGYHPDFTEDAFEAVHDALSVIGDDLSPYGDMHDADGLYRSFLNGATRAGIVFG